MSVAKVRATSDERIQSTFSQYFMQEVHVNTKITAP